MVTPEMILAAAATEFRTSVKDIIGIGRVRALVEARAYVAVWLRVALRMSYPAIGRVLRRDHSTVMYLCGKLAERPPAWLKAAS